jgi:5-methylcytosine-specific restriction endonuclease McrA
MDIDSPPPTQKRPRKKAIPKAVRVAVWNTYVGHGVGQALCPVCRHTVITPFTYHCAHVVAEACGGPTTVANLRPTCATCNLSMRTTNLDVFRETHFLAK